MDSQNRKNLIINECNEVEITDPFDEIEIKGNTHLRVIHSNHVSDITLHIEGMRRPKEFYCAMEGKKLVLDFSCNAIMLVPTETLSLKKLSLSAKNILMHIFSPVTLIGDLTIEIENSITDVRLESLRTNNLNVSIQDTAGNLSLAGQTKTQTIKINSIKRHCGYIAKKLKSDYCDINIIGNNFASICVKNKLSKTIPGDNNLSVCSYCDPPTPEEIKQVLADDYLIYIQEEAEG